MLVGPSATWLPGSTPTHTRPLQITPCNNTTRCCPTLAALLPRHTASHPHPRTARPHSRSTNEADSRKGMRGGCPAGEGATLAHSVSRMYDFQLRNHEINHTRTSLTPNSTRVPRIKRDYATAVRVCAARGVLRSVLRGSHGACSIVALPRILAHCHLPRVSCLRPHIVTRSHHTRCVSHVHRKSTRTNEIAIAWYNVSTRQANPALLI